MTVATLAEKHRPVRLLIVEDNIGDAMLIRRAFAQSNVPHEITVARTGEEALNLLNYCGPTSQPDIILLDLNLPGMSGYEVLKTIKSDRCHKRIPVFVLSSSLAAEDVMGSYDAHANCYLVKPHDLDSLREITHRIGEFWFSLAVLPSGKIEGNAA